MFFFLLIFSIPIYGFCFWGIKDPEEVHFIFEAWSYKEFPKFSDVYILLQRIGYVIAIIVWTIILILVGIDTFTPDPPPPTIPEDLKIK